MPSGTKPSKHRARWIAVAIAALVVVGGGATAAALIGAAGEQPAAAQGTIHADTRMGAVELRAADLAGMTAYYGPDGVGLEVLAEGDDEVSVGVDGEELVRLVAGTGAPASPADASLFHTAILFPDAPTLATALVALATTYPHLYGGASDHAASHAFYFGDPEGNGVELYVDTPAETWVWQNGEVQMGSAPLDINAFVAQHYDGSTNDASMGHVHLKVGDLEQAERFYGDLLGFAVTARADGAVFFAAGGYHHHLAANTWGSGGAGPRPDALGLGSLAVVLPDDAALAAVETRLTDAGLAFERAGGGIVVADPWGTRVELADEEPAAG